MDDARQEEQRIDDFIAGRLTADERADFVAACERDPSLADRVKVARFLRDGAELSARRDLRERLAGLRPPDETATRSLAWWLPRLAAGLLLLLAVLAALQWYNHRDTVLAQRYFQPPQLAVNPRGAGQATDPALLIQQGQYQAALSLIGQALATTSGNTRLHYLSGTAHFYLGNYAEAADQFGKVVASGDSLYLEDAQFSQLLSLLAAGRSDEAAFADLLRQILADSDHPRREEAEGLARRLEAIWR